MRTPQGAAVVLSREQFDNVLAIRGKVGQDIGSSDVLGTQGTAILTGSLS